MPHVALSQGERFYLGAMSREELWARYPRGEARQVFTCPACEQRMTLVVGKKVIPHFRHLPDQSCTFEGHAISQAHLDHQANLYHFFATLLKLPSVQVEALIPMVWRPKGRIADLLLRTSHDRAGSIV